MFYAKSIIAVTGQMEINAVLKGFMLSATQEKQRRPKQKRIVKPLNPYIKKAGHLPGYLFNMKVRFPITFFSRIVLFIENPIPGLVGTDIIPFSTETPGVMTSSSQNRLEAEISPGIVNPGNEARAILWARETPNSIIPPHHTGMPFSAQ